MDGETEYTPQLEEWVAVTERLAELEEECSQLNREGEWCVANVKGLILRDDATSETVDKLTGTCEDLHTRLDWHADRLSTLADVQRDLLVSVEAHDDRPGCSVAGGQDVALVERVEKIFMSAYENRTHPGQIWRGWNGWTKDAILAVADALEEEAPAWNMRAYEWLREQVK